MLVSAVIHDLVEAYSGDTPARGGLEYLATKAEREEAAFCRIESEFSWLGAMIRAYEAQTTPAARAIKRGLDKVAPVAVWGLNPSPAAGLSYSWNLLRLIERVDGRGPFYNLGLELVLRFCPIAAE